MANEQMIKLVNLTKTISFGDENIKILKDIHFSLNKGESLAIRGRSGSGKTTLLGIMAGLDTANEGEVWLNGKDLAKMNEDERALHRAEYVGFVFQSFQLLPALTAIENVMVPLELKRHRSALSQAEAYLHQMGMGDRLSHYPSQLSGGEQQRVAIARAFASEPAILFADEPTGNLDATTGQQIIDLLFNMNAKTNTTLVMVTHDSQLAARCQQQRILQQGYLATDDELMQVN
jgi:putative ABC transport system ATP-binding protein